MLCQRGAGAAEGVHAFQVPRNSPIEARISLRVTLQKHSNVTRKKPLQSNLVRSQIKTMLGGETGKITLEE